MARLPSGLPKSNLIWCRFRKIGLRPIWFAKFRCANFMFVWLGPLEIGWRMPWLEHAARQIHPELFTRQAREVK